MIASNTAAARVTTPIPQTPDDLQTAGRTTCVAATMDWFADHWLQILIAIGGRRR